MTKISPATAGNSFATPSQMQCGRDTPSLQIATASITLPPEIGARSVMRNLLVLLSLTRASVPPEVRNHSHCDHHDYVICAVPI
jgi:hypothetical protein